MDAVDDKGWLVLGLLHIGGIELAVPTANLREAVDHPARLSPLLSNSPHVAGAIDVRGDLVPVVDLRHALGLPTDDTVTRRIIIVNHHEHVFGIVVDALGGVITVPEERSQVMEVLKPQSMPLLRRLFSLDEGKRIVNLLCLDGIAALFDLPLARARASSDAGKVSAVAAQSWSPYVLFECGNVRLAIDANVVDTVIDVDHVEGGMARGEGCLGLINSGQRRMAVVDALDILGLGRTETKDNKQVLVLKCEGNSVGILIRHVTRIARLNDGTRRPVPGMAFVAPEFFNGMLPLEGEGDFLSVAVAPFLATTEISSMATIHGRPVRDKLAQGQAQGQSAGVRRSKDVHLTFRIGQELAAPLKQVREILPMPVSMTPIRREGDPRIGLFTHRNAIVPIIDLAVLLGVERAPVSSETRLLLIDGQAGTLALLVERVHAIESALWEHAPIGTAAWRDADELDAALHVRGLLTLGEGAEKRGVSALDLPRIARAIEGRYASAAASGAREAPTGTETSASKGTLKDAQANAVTA